MSFRSIILAIKELEERIVRLEGDIISGNLPDFAAYQQATRERELLIDIRNLFNTALHEDPHD